MEIKKLGMRLIPLTFTHFITSKTSKVRLSADSFKINYKYNFFAPKFLLNPPLLEIIGSVITF